MKNFSAQIDKINSKIILSLVFLVPLFFLPITTEFFEFNKLILITIATFLILILWTIRTYNTKVIFTIKSQLNIFLNASLVLIAVSTLFSINKHVSIFGQYQRWFPSLFVILIFGIFFYISGALFAENKFKENILKTFFSSITLASFIATLSYNNFITLILKNVEYFNYVEFNTTGSQTTLTVLAAIGGMIGFWLITQNKAVIYKSFITLGTLINIYVIIVYGNPAGTVVLFLGFLLYFLIDKIINKQKTNVMLVILTITTVVSFTFTKISVTNQFILNNEFSKEVKLPFNMSWIVASTTARDYPFLGTGPSTFLYAFSSYKPLALNQSEFWAVNFDKPYNEALNVLANLGIVGFLVISFTYFKLLSKTGNKIVVSKGTEHLTIDQLAGVLMLLVLVSYLFATASIQLVFITMVILLVTHINKENIVELGVFSGTLGTLIETKHTNFIAYTLSIVVLPVLIMGLIITTNMYRAEYYMRKAFVAITENRLEQAYELQKLAIKYNTKRTEYRNSYAQTNVALSKIYLSQITEDMSDQEKKQIQDLATTLIVQAVRQTIISTESINRYDVKNWETRANIYNSLIGIVQNVEEKAIEAYANAISLDPINPSLRLQLGNTYLKQQKYNEAAQAYRQAITLKQDYATAHYNYATVLKLLNNYSLAQTELEIAKSLVPVNSPDYNIVTNELEEISNLLHEQNTQLTAEQLEQAAKGSDITNNGTQLTAEELPTTENTNIDNQTQ